jgi:hypothetical protein
MEVCVALTVELVRLFEHDGGERWRTMRQDDPRTMANDAAGPTVPKNVLGFDTD